MKLAKFLLLALLVCALPARATTYSTDASDLWWNANESGWGVNVIQQYNILFMTFFIYGTDGKPSWYVASNVSPTSAAFTYSGALYRTTGPWFGTTFNPNAVGVTQVGTATFALTFIEQAALTYTIDGVTVTKQLRRQTLANNQVGGTYTGALRQTNAGCGPGGQNGTFVIPANVSVSHFNTAFSMTVAVNGDSCVYSGTYKQDGRMGQVISGPYNCSSGTAGTFSLFEIQASTSGISGRFTAANNFCSTVSGRFSAVRN